MIYRLADKGCAWRNSQSYFSNAKIAQLVEHDLAKVGVAGSSPVFRSLYRDARMVELVDTQDLKSCGHCGCAGSSPASSTPKIRKSNIVRLPFFYAFEEYVLHNPWNKFLGDDQIIIIFVRF